MLVLIPTAGIGSRLDYNTKFFNKAMIQIGDLPVISHIIDSYPETAKFLIILGYKGDHIKEYLKISYPNKKIFFRTIKNYDGPGSGLTLTLKKALPCIHEPFFFHCNDTIFLDKYFYKNISEDTMYIHKKNPDSMKYSTVELNSKINLKLNYLKKNCYNYTGVAFIKNYKLFKKIILNEKKSIGELTYFKNLDIKKIKFKFIKSWYDIGSHETKQIAERDFNKKNILPKADQGIFFKNQKVIKFFTNPDTIQQRFMRSKVLKNFVPKIISKKKYFFTYKFVEGEIFSSVKRKHSKFKWLLSHLKESFWSFKNLKKDEIIDFESKCYNFYYEKTYSRINFLYEKNNLYDCKNYINNFKIPSLKSLFDKIDWNLLNKGLATNFHGDLHFENIILTKKKNKIKLLDWRENFSSLIDYGDIYYDFAKINHGLILDHNVINSSKYSVRNLNKKVKLTFKQSSENIKCQKELGLFLRKNKFSIYKTNIITALIFLNISALHHYPYSIFLYYLGKLYLFESLKNKNKNEIITIKS